MHRILTDDLDPGDLVLWVMVNGLRVMWLVVFVLAAQRLLGHVRLQKQKAWSVKM